MIHSIKFLAKKTMGVAIIALFFVTLLPAGLIVVGSASADGSSPVQLTPIAPYKEASYTQYCEDIYQLDEDSNGPQSGQYNYTYSVKLPADKNHSHNSGHIGSADSSVFYIRSGAQSITTLTAVRAQDYFVNAAGQHVSTYQYTEVAPNAPDCSTQNVSCTTNANSVPALSVQAGSSIDINIANYCEQPGGTASELSVSKAYATKSQPGEVYPNGQSITFPTSGTNYQQIITYHAPNNCYGSTDKVNMLGTNVYGETASKYSSVYVNTTQPKGGNLPLCENVK